MGPGQTQLVCVCVFETRQNSLRSQNPELYQKRAWKGKNAQIHSNKANSLRSHAFCPETHRVKTQEEKDLLDIRSVNESHAHEYISAGFAMESRGLTNAQFNSKLATWLRMSPLYDWAVRGLRALLRCPTVANSVVLRYDLLIHSPRSKSLL